MSRGRVVVSEIGVGGRQLAKAWEGKGRVPLTQFIRISQLNPSFAHGSFARPAQRTETRALSLPPKLRARILL